MQIFPSIKEYSLNNWLIIIGSGLMGAYAWNLHFIIEFSALLRVQASSFIFIAFHLFFITFGCLFVVKLASKIDHYLTYLTSVTFLGVSLIGLVLITNLWIISLLLAIAGFSIGVGLGVVHYQLAFIFNKPQFSGRLYSLALMSIAPFMVIESVIDLAGENYIWLNILFLAIILLLIIGSVLIGKKDHILYTQQNEHKPIIKRVIKNKWSLGFAYLWGFFFTNTYYSTILVFDINNLIDQLNIFVIEVASIFFFFSFIVGLLADKIGRRTTVVMGFFIQALAFMILPFIQNTNAQLIRTTLLVLFPITIGLGFTLSIISGLVLMFELSPKNKVRNNMSVHLGFVGLGMGSGVLLGEAIKNLIEIEPFFLSIILLFIVIIALIVVFQVEETLPPQIELEWKRSVKYLLVLSNSGVPIYKQSLEDTSLVDEEANGLLLGGALKAMTSLVQDIARNEDSLKVIKQKDFSILMEESNNILVSIIAKKDLKQIRQRMREFATAFEKFFEDALDKQATDEIIYLSSKNLVEKIFDI